MRLGYEKGCEETGKWRGSRDQFLFWAEEKHSGYSVFGNSQQSSCCTDGGRQPSTQAGTATNLGIAGCGLLSGLGLLWDLRAYVSIGSYARLILRSQRGSLQAPPGRCALPSIITRGEKDVHPERTQGCGRKPDAVEEQGLGNSLQAGVSGL